MTEEIIWESKLDGRFDCQVVRIRNYAGRLTVKDGDTVLLDKEVGLAYGAKFGPDIDDLVAWQDACMAVIDGR